LNPNLDQPGGNFGGDQCNSDEHFTQDYVTLEGDLSYGPGETQKVVPVQLLELGEKASLLDDKQVKQFVMDLSNPWQGAKLGRYPRTTITIADEPGEPLPGGTQYIMFTGPQGKTKCANCCCVLPMIVEVYTKYSKCVALKCLKLCSGMSVLAKGVLVGFLYMFCHCS